MDTGWRDGVVVSSCTTCRQPQFAYVTVASTIRWTTRALRQWKFFFLCVLFLWPLTFKNILNNSFIHYSYVFGISLACTSGHMQCPWRTEEGNWFLGIRDTDGCEVPDRCRECNLGPLKSIRVESSRVESSRVPSTAESSFQLLTISHTLDEVI